MLPIAPRPDEARALDCATLAASLAGLRETYEYIVIDGPAMGSGPEIPMLEDAADGLLFAVRSDRARARQLRYATEQVSPHHLLGVVLLET